MCWKGRLTRLGCAASPRIAIVCDSCTHASQLGRTRCLARVIGDLTTSKSRLQLLQEAKARSVHVTRRGWGRTRGRKYIHWITVRVELEKLGLGPLGFPRRFFARKWGRLFGMDIIVAEAVHGILAVSALQLPKREESKP